MAETDAEMWLLGIFQRQAALVASRLRDAADDVERHASSPFRNLSDSKPELAPRVGEILGDVTNALANCSFSGMVRAAAEFDRYVRAPQDENPKSEDE